MSYVLRDYQQKASDAAVSFFNNKAKKTNAIMVLPTGSGKSLIIADIAARLDGHTLVFQPSKEILEQNFKKLCSYSFMNTILYFSASNPRSNNPAPAKKENIDFAIIESPLYYHYLLIN